MTRPDLSHVDLLCHLQRAAQTLGCRFVVHDAGADLVELLELSGLDRVLLADPPTTALAGPPASPDPGS
ncbi:MAG: STAS domain-containing protein [Acidimicrobiales bacterium]|jgi:ABC-type transporter Mla MlaB component|nr:STAS domain-containing protein [Acidimicrobiales bacterium]